METASDLIGGNKMPANITSTWIKFYSPESPQNTVESEIETPKERYLSPENRKQINDELRLVQYNN